MYYLLFCSSLTVILYCSGSGSHALLPFSGIISGAPKIKLYQKKTPMFIIMMTNINDTIGILMPTRPWSRADIKSPAGVADYPYHRAGEDMLDCSSIELDTGMSRGTKGSRFYGPS